MSGKLGFGSSKSTTNQKSQSDPWDETIPYLQDLLKRLDGASGPGEPGPTQGQTDAINQLKDNAAKGNPWTGQIGALTDDLFATQSGAPRVSSAYDDLVRRLTPTADGTNLNVTNNPEIQKMLQNISDDTQTRINAQFAGAGRALSGYNQRAVGEGVSRAQLPVLVDQFNREQGRTDAAARDLFDASKTSAGAEADLDAKAAAQRGAGIDTAKSFLEAQNYGPNSLLSLEEQQKKLPYDELSWLAELLYPAAQLGQQSTGTSTTKSSQIGGQLGWKQ